MWFWPILFTQVPAYGYLEVKPGYFGPTCGQTYLPKNGQKHVYHAR